MIQNNLAQLLKERDKTLYWLAKETKIGYGNLSRHRNNKATEIQFDFLEKICQALSCRVDELLTIIDPTEKKSK